MPGRGASPFEIHTGRLLILSDNISIFGVPSRRLRRTAAASETRGLENREHDNAAGRRRSAGREMSAADRRKRRLVSGGQDRVDVGAYRPNKRLQPASVPYRLSVPSSLQADAWPQKRRPSAEPPLQELVEDRIVAVVSVAALFQPGPQRPSSRTCSPPCSGWIPLIASSNRGCASWNSSRSSAPICAVTAQAIDDHSPRFHRLRRPYGHGA